jgi:hypothetical protein
MLSITVLWKEIDDSATNSTEAIFGGLTNDEREIFHGWTEFALMSYSRRMSGLMQNVFCMYGASLFVEREFSWLTVAFTALIGVSDLCVANQSRAIVSG